MQNLEGRHGFNNSVMDMHPFFIALGPSFKQGYVSEPFENIHIYELMCHLLGVSHTWIANHPMAWINNT